MLFCWVGVLSMQVPSLSGRQCSLWAYAVMLLLLKFPFSIARKAVFLCDMDIISRVELCIGWKLLLGGLYCQFFICYLLVWICTRALRVLDYVKWSFRALSRVRKAAVRVITTDIVQGWFCKCCTGCHCSSHPGQQLQARLWVRLCKPDKAVCGHCPWERT